MERWPRLLAKSGYYGDSRGVTQVLLPPSFQTKRDDGTALTAPNSSQWVAAPAFPSASSLPLLSSPSPPENSIHKSGLGISGSRPGAKELRRGGVSKSVLQGGQVEASITGFSG